MDTFLKEVAQQLVTAHPHDLETVTVVFNNRRSGLFLRKQLEKICGEAFFLPRTMGIDELVEEFSGLTIVPREFLLFELYDIHRKINTQDLKYSTFSEFIPFGEMMLSDFSEIDLYMVDAQQLFNYLHDTKKIDTWDIEGKAPTPGQEAYLRFYKSLYQYYTELRSRLTAQQQAYGGMAYRKVAEEIDSMVDKSGYSNIYFVGFNALSQSEQQIIQTLVKRGIGNYITDGDAYYYNNSKQEAGNFLRKHHRYFHLNSDFANHFSSGHKQITIVNCPEDLLQVKYAGSLLDQLFTHQEINEYASAGSTNSENQKAEYAEQTAIVLADEGLLLPMLNSLPESVSCVNVTMGYPFIHTSLYTLTLKLISLYQHNKAGKFHHKDIEDLFSDYCIIKLLGNKHIYHFIRQNFINKKIIYANHEVLSTLFENSQYDISTISFLFEIQDITPKQFFEIAKHLIGNILESNIFEHNKKELNATSCLLEIINYFETIQTRYQYIDNWDILQKIYSRIAQRRMVPFIGEPLSGLQLLGMLETRNLDFKRIILLSANEGILPSGRSDSTLIPLNIKSVFSIPTYREKDAIFAYHFYRLLQRAEEIYIVYNSKADSLGKGEMSRFVKQIESELSKKYPQNIELKHFVVSASNNYLISNEAETIQKTDTIANRLNELCEKGFAPTTLNCYHNCPKRFYYEYILQIKETQEIHEDMDQSELGTCIHAVLQTIYGTAPDGIIRIETLQKGLNNIDHILQKQIDTMFTDGIEAVGRNHFLATVAKSQIKHFLHHEIQLLKSGETIIIKGLEHSLNTTMHLSVNGQPSNVNLIGKADRIDIINNQFRVVDYKSGKVNSKDLSVTESAIQKGNYSDKWFQVMQYAWLVSQDKQWEGMTREMLSGIYPLSSIGSGFLPAMLNNEKMLTQETFDFFENDVLQPLLNNLLDANNPFEAKPNVAKCQYCPFAHLCTK